MRGLAVWVVVLGAACGRIDFAERTATGDGGGSDGQTPPGWSQLVAYADQTCAVLSGQAYCWGANASGQLGTGTTTDAPAPARVLLPAGTISSLAQGESHGCAVVDAVLYCFGSTVGGSLPTVVSLRPSPTVVPVLGVSAGRGFTCASGNDVYCWGENGSGQLGLGDTMARTSPEALGLGASYVEVRAGDDHACAFGPSGPRCWGHNDDGTLGDGMTQSVQGSSSIPVAVIGGVQALPLIAGWHACALQAGQVLCWGEGDHGELGDGGTANADTPQPVPGLSGATALAVGGGPTDLDASCAVRADGGVVCWGNGKDGRLGQGTTSNSGLPVPVVGLPGPATDVAIGYDHACALLVSGDLWCWGSGVHGQLGDGRMSSSLVPVEVTRP